MIPKNGWKPMATAPHDGTMVMVKYVDRSIVSRPTELIRASSFMCDGEGRNWTWMLAGASFHIIRDPIGWMTVSELQAAQAAEAAEEAPQFDL